jgi:CRISPR/Cas system-associated exonuclease Cas4 (RecB family)
MKQLKISQSSYTTFHKCSKMFQWQFIDEIPPEKGSDNIYAVFGTSFHKALELHLKYNLDCDDLVNGWKVLFLNYFSEARNLSEKDKKLKQKFMQMGEAFIKNAFEMKLRWQDYLIVESEKGVKIPFKNDYFENVFLTGKIDLILKNVLSFVCLDWKTSKNKDEDIDSNDQLTFYIYFIHNLFNIKFEDIFGALAYPFDKDIKFTQRTIEDVNNLFGKINKMIERIYKNDFIKEPKMNFNPDDCFFCPYKKRCENVN